MWKVLNKWWLVRAISKQANLSNQQTQPLETLCSSASAIAGNTEVNETENNVILSYLPKFQLPLKTANQSRTVWLSLWTRVRFWSPTRAGKVGRIQVPRTQGNGGTALQRTIWLPKWLCVFFLCCCLPAAQSQEAPTSGWNPREHHLLSKTVDSKPTPWRLGLSQPWRLPEAPVLGLFTSHMAQIKTALPYQTINSVPDMQVWREN